MAGTQQLVTGTGPGGKSVGPLAGSVGVGPRRQQGRVHNSSPSDEATHGGIDRILLD